MAKAKFDIKTIQTTVQTEAQRGLHAGVGVADRALEAVKDYVAGAQKQLTKAQRSVQRIDLQPKALRSQASTVLSARVEELSKEAKARRDAVEKRVAELQAEAQKFVADNVESAADTFDDLVQRGETVVKRIRRVPTSTPSNPANIKAPAAKSTATRSSATRARKAPATRTTARKTSARKTTPRKTTARKTTARKTTKTTARKTAASAS